MYTFVRLGVLKNINLKLILPLGLFLLVYGCSDIIIKDTETIGRYQLGEQSISITTDPTNSKITLESMGSRKVWHAISPTEFAYTPRPGMPSVVTVAKDGYQTKKIRVEPGMKNLHVVLEKVSSFNFNFGGMPGRGMGSGRGGPNIKDIPGISSPAPGTTEEGLNKQPKTE